MNRLLLILLLVLPTLTLAQKYPERRFIRQGNRHYEHENYPRGEVAYRRALEKTPESYPAAWNLGKTLYKQERWDEAHAAIAPLAADSTHLETAAAAYYDAGNALVKQRKLQEALEAYKQSLRLDPTDREAKFNLAYVQKLLENEEGEQETENRNQETEQPQPQPQNTEEQPSQGGMSRQEAEQLLEAMQAREENRKQEAGNRREATEASNGKNW